MHTHAHTHLPADAKNAAVPKFSPTSVTLYMPWVDPEVRDMERSTGGRKENSSASCCSGVVRFTLTPFTVRDSVQLTPRPGPTRSVMDCRPVSTSDEMELTAVEAQADEAPHKDMRSLFKRETQTQRLAQKR